MSVGHTNMPRRTHGYHYPRPERLAYGACAVPGLKPPVMSFPYQDRGNPGEADEFLALRCSVISSQASNYLLQIDIFR
jgi:hypothetical protein